MKTITILSLLLICINISHGQDSPNTSIAKKYVYAGLNGNDFSAFDQIFSPKYVNHQTPWVTIERMRKSIELAKLSFPDLRSKVEDVIESGNKVVLRTAFEGTYTGKQMGNIPVNGKSFKIESIDIFIISNGQILEHWGQDSTYDIGRQLKQ
jgi:predicted ester cyclase